jgi:hypothetical protein
MSVRTIYQNPTDNLVPSATITCATEDPVYPVENLYDGVITTVFKSSALSAEIVFEFPAPVTLRFIALGPNNLDPTLPVTFAGNATNTWGAPSMSGALVIPDRWENGRGYCPWADLTSFSGFGAHLFYRLSLGTNSVFPELGELWLSESLRTFEQDWLMEHDEDESQNAVILETEYGQISAYDMYVRRRTWTTPYNASDAHLAELKSWHRAMKGSVVPSVMIPKSNLNDAAWVRHQPGFTRHFSDGRHNLTFVLREESHGLVGITD